MIQTVPDPDDVCRCGHAAGRHSVGRGYCLDLKCSCRAVVVEDPLATASRVEAAHEILECVVHLDHRYARMPRMPW